MQRIGVCCKCFEVTVLQRHHVWQKKYYGKNDSVLLLCDDCHKEIHAILPRKKLSKQALLYTHKQWIREGGFP